MFYSSMYYVISDGQLGQSGVIVWPCMASKWWEGTEGHLGAIVVGGNHLSQVHTMPVPQETLSHSAPGPVII